MEDFHWQVVSCFAYLDHVRVFKGMFTAVVTGSNTLQNSVFPVFVMPVDQIFYLQFFFSLTADFESQMASVF